MANTLNINIDRQVPSLFVHTVWDEIFTQKGLTYSGIFFNSSDFKSRVITPSKGYVNTIIDGDTTTQSTNNGSGTIAHTDAVGQQYIDVIKSGTFTADSDYKFNLIGSVSYTTTDLIIIRLKINGSIVWSKTLHNTLQEDDLVFNEVFNLYQKNLDTYSIELVTASAFLVSDYRVNMTWDITTLQIDTLLRSINIDFSTMFENETQISFVKDIMQRFGLIYRKTRNTNNYEFIQLKTLLNDKTNAEDWSNKYSRFISETYKPNYAQKNYLRYMYDDNDTNISPRYANGTMTVTNVNLNQTKTLFTSAFKASKLADGSNVYYDAKLWELDDDNLLQPLNNGMRFFKVTTENNKLVSYGWNDSESNYNDTITHTYLDFNNQNYDTELNNNYSELNELLNSYKKIVVEVNLTLIDIYNLDFFKLKYLKQTGKYYYLNKVINYKKGKITKVELIEVI